MTAGRYRDHHGGGVDNTTRSSISGRRQPEDEANAIVYAKPAAKYRAGSPDPALTAPTRVQLKKN